MHEIFGLPMSTIMVVLLAVLTLFLFAVALIAWRRPVLFKLGVRNIPRRRAQSTLIVVGLMLSTLIISAALGVGDTLEYSATSDVYRQLGHVDELVVKSRTVDAGVQSALTETIDADTLGLVESAVAGDDSVDGVMPLLDVRVPVINETAGQVEPSVILTGIDPARLDAFGGLKAANGGTVDLGAVGDGQVVISEKAAEALDAKVGDALTIYHANTPVTLTVADIAANSTLAGQRETAISMVMPLDRLQALTEQEGTLTAVAISNAGGVRDSAAADDAVVAKLAPVLEGKQLGVAKVKETAVDNSQQLASVFSSLFLVLGLFSVAAGVLLIVLIFTMLAAERRSEMGMARAVGTHRRQLIQQFIAEGSGYAILSGFVGAGLGVLATFGIAAGMQALLGEFLPIEPHVTPRSLVVAYSLGMVITFLAVVGSSWKVSRLNVVAAVRDIPDVQSPARKKSGLVWGVLFLLGGALLALQGLAGDQAFPFYAGMSLVPFGIARILRFFGVPGRPVYSVVGMAVLILWMLPQNVAEKLFGTLDGDMEMFFLSGIFMVIGATIVIVQNTGLLLAGVSRFGSLFRSQLPAVRTAVAYPGASTGRTGMTIAMFSLIIFSLVMIATMNHNYVNLFLGDEANAGWDVRADAQSANPIADFEGTLAQKGVATDGFTAVGTVTSPSLFASEARLADTDAWKQTVVHGMDAAFIDNAELAFQQRAEGYATDEDIVRALASQPNVAVIDASALPGGSGIGMGDDALKLDGLTSADETFAPVTVELAAPDGGTATVTVIGIIDSKIGSLTGLYAAQSTLDAVYPKMASTSWYVALADPAQADTVAKEIESALMHNGVQGASIRDELKDAQQQEAGFLYLIEGFMGLGLFVGVAAVGVIAFRSVVERRQQIGVLRALGYQRGMVSLSFLIETAFVVGMGVLSGTTLGLVLSRNLFMADDAASTGFTVPWMIIGTILVATIAVALLMTWMPSRQAARIAPAEALRYE
ncbi:MAG TPA: FtsX-like permease family protein [Thermomicrobiales bacterium]|nr:FtsX-like permease family protein [Thermomicrobiales bacterium]